MSITIPTTPALPEPAPLAASAIDTCELPGTPVLAPREAGQEADQSPPGDRPEGGKGGTGERPPSPPFKAPVAGHAPAPPPLGPRDDLFRLAPEVNPALTALRQAGLYGHSVGAGEHCITCPFVAEHAPGEPQDARYFEPSADAPIGAFHCPCDHREPRQIGAFLDKLGIDRQVARCKPRVRVKQGELHRVVGAAETVLAQRGDLYRFNGMIVSLKDDPETRDIKTEPATEATLSLHLSAACDWEKFDSRSDEWRRCDVPSHVVSTLLKSEGVGALPTLTRLARQPYLMGLDGKLVTQPGFDPATGTFATFDPAAFHLPSPTRDNALIALARLTALLHEFEFAKDIDRSTVISAMLTASIRDYLDVAPAFNITASSPGSGKSYLASVISPFAGPGEPRNISYPGTNEEATKVVLSLAIEQPAAVCFDDMPMDWLPHGAMNRMLTSGRISERKLGSNTVITARASSFIMGTGNNIRPVRDMARRVASIYILPQVEVAATRDFTGRPADEVRRHRGRYVSDALTIIGAWKAAGSPKAEAPNVAGFEQWSDLCRHSLMWLGLPDPATSLIEQIAHDPDTELLGELLHAWKDAFGERPTMVRRVLRKIEDDKNGDLYDAVMELPCVERGHVNQSRFGRYLGRNKNRIVRGLQLVEAEHSERRAWAVIRVAPGEKKVVTIAPDEPVEGFESAWLDQMLADGKSPTTLAQAA
jgi:hypothetical protein